MKSFIRNTTKTLKATNLKIIQRGLQNKINFEVNKTKTILFIKKRKLAKEINQAKIRLENNNISYNKEAIK
jgi:hypothetical protein